MLSNSRRMPNSTDCSVYGLFVDATNSLTRPDSPAAMPVSCLAASSPPEGTLALTPGELASSKATELTLDKSFLINTNVRCSLQRTR